MNKKAITIIFVIILIVTIVTVLIINKNNEMQKVVVAGNDIQVNEELTTNESIKSSKVELIEESSTPLPKITPTPIISKETYYIKVNNQMNTVTIYTKDENGDYTNAVKAMVCSTGNATPKNSKYKTKGKWNWGPLFGGVYGQYVTQINGNILFHSVPYLKKGKHNSLEYWEYDKLGTTASAGCVRLTVADAKWIYDNCPVGTTVEFYSNSNPGPLGKPTAMKISSYTGYRDWDPTDPETNNPWKNFIIDEIMQKHK